MLEFLPIPLEIIDIILEYYNIYKVEHMKRFKDALNSIESYPRFIEQKVRKNEVYYQFDYEDHNYYVISKSSYLKTIRFVVRISLNI